MGVDYSGTWLRIDEDTGALEVDERTDGEENNLVITYQWQGVDYSTLPFSVKYSMGCLPFDWQDFTVFDPITVFVIQTIDTDYTLIQAQSNLYIDGCNPTDFKIYDAITKNEITDEFRMDTTGLYARNDN